MAPGTLAAVRTDPGTGVREEASFRLVHGTPMFCVLHTPTRSQAGVVICPPVHVEFEKNYRREVLLARALASRGIAVFRFHYRGTGHSGGAVDDLTFESMSEDANEACAHLREDTGVTTLGFVGTRWGSLVGAAAASRVEDGPLALWEPVIEGVHYVSELFRASIVRDITSGSERRTQEAILEEMRAKGRVEVLGYTFTRPFYDSAVQRSLRKELGERPRPVLIVQFTQRGSLRAKYRTEARYLTDRGFPVEARVSPLEEVWFFEGHWKPPAALLDMTTDWLAARLGVGMDAP